MIKSLLIFFLFLMKSKHKLYVLLNLLTVSMEIKNVPIFINTLIIYYFYGALSLLIKIHIVYKTKHRKEDKKNKEAK